MRTIHAAALSVLLVAASLGSTAEPPIRVPSAPVVPQPMPAPPGPDASLRLVAEQLFVIDSDLPVIVLASPKGLVSVTQEAGPIRIRGKFADGSGKVESRTFKGKQVVTVEALASGKVELLVVPMGATKEADVIRRTLDVEAGDGPRPPPKPPEPKPVDPVDPAAPIPAAGLRVLIVFESADLAKMPPAQSAAIYSAKVREYLNANCVVGTDAHQTREWRMWDQDTDVSGESKLWQDAMKRPRKSIPWVIVSNGRTGFEGPLPANADELLALVRKYEVK